MYEPRLPERGLLNRTIYDFLVPKLVTATTNDDDNDDDDDDDDDHDDDHDDDYDDDYDDELERCLVRHGTDINAIYDPCYDVGYTFSSYWKTVVASGDVAWATELLANYSANPEWPCESDFSEAFDRFAREERDCDGDRGDDFSTVLMVAIRKQDLPMARLLLDHGAGVNTAKPNFAGDHDENQDEKPGEMPLSVALETGNVAIIELLKSKGAHE
eukprot:SAG11_NODE_454_length_9347_cov_4.117539_4_plen_215_part_00